MKIDLSPADLETIVMTLDLAAETHAETENVFDTPGELIDARGLAERLRKQLVRM